MRQHRFVQNVASISKLLRIREALRFAMIIACGALPQSALAQSSLDYEQTIPEAVRGPFVSRSDVVTELDCPTAECKGVFSFSRLMEARIPASERSKHYGNPFLSSIGKPIRMIIEDDLAAVDPSKSKNGQALNPKFLSDEHSRIELVGIVNRMDRQFVKDPSVGVSKEQQGCGEISLIYRFAYSIRDGKQQSRLPVTMNLVFPALPFNTRNGKITCQEMARRWLAEVRRPIARTTKQYVSDLLDPSSGAVSTIDGRDILRLELNMQEYRVKAANDQTGFGTEASYLLRVFRWSRGNRVFEESFLGNQIDRNAVLQNESMRRKLVGFLLKDDTIASIDAGIRCDMMTLPPKNLMFLRLTNFSPWTKFLGIPSY
jgi:hypothetical protein